MARLILRPALISDEISQLRLAFEAMVERIKEQISTNSRNRTGYGGKWWQT